jgi:hypothetical protein
MSSANRPNRKAADEPIIRYNSVGLSLGWIAKKLGVHSTTITLRLASLGIQPADTRRTFMADIYEGLTPDQQDWLVDQLGPHTSIKDYLKNLLVKEYVTKNP